ncbi:4123_t:CDS:2 [Dentiscutata erythropus]|uniref:4123_t:CDS:1 n=1 Tax=Dentiscutata erythropus TaxID=1348616 RepID=A0A9N9E3B1_9GLOM|nr:4123_t:CDS:2 [Dentiscutata erythropus]
MPNIDIILERVDFDVETVQSPRINWYPYHSQSDECTYISSNMLKVLKPLPPTDGPVARCYNIELIIKELAPDGYTRLVWTVNGQYPAPVIQANYGDRLLINVTNKLGYPSSVHWHGIFQNGTNFYDGVVGMTQCAIPDGVSFLYNFTVQQYGTYWYHSHFLGQIVDGLKGPLIIHYRNDPYLGKYDFEYVMTLSDWYHTLSSDILKLFRAEDYKGFDPLPDSGEISGFGQYDCNTAPKNSTCNPNNKIATYVVRQGKKYRFRIINMSSLVHFILSIDDHPLTLFEVDGELIKPVTLNTIPINIGQRYSVILNAIKPIDVYQIRAKISICTPINNQTINYDTALNYNIMGILKYEGAKVKLPTSNAFFSNVSEECRDIDPNTLKSYYTRKLPQIIISRIDLMVSFGKTATGKKHALINNSSYVPNFNYPTNQRIIEGVNPFNLPQYDNAYVYECNTTDCDVTGVDIYIINNTSDPHPFHLHGHNFFVIYNGKSQTGLEPPRKSSTTVIRYFVNNPGAWYFHCHIHWHFEMGMSVQLIEKPSLLKNISIPNDVAALCNF